jgi:hypothetical protein
MATWHMYVGLVFLDNQVQSWNRRKEAEISVMATVAILGGDSVVGRALEALLQGLGYDTLLIEESGAAKPEELLRGIQVLVAAPTADTESRERFLADMRGTPRTAAIPVLTLSTVIKKDRADQPGLVLWPCRMEDLRTEIEAALLTAAAEEPASHGSQVIPEKLEAPSHPVDSPSSATGSSVAQGDVAGSSFSPPVSFGSDP